MQHKKKLRNRYTQCASLALHLTVGALLILGASWLFGGIAKNVMSGASLTVIDQKILEWLNKRHTPGMTTLMRVITSLASFTWVTCAVTVSALVLGWKKAWHRLLLLILVVPGGMALVPLLKATFNRQRPSLNHALQIFSGYSFPSGHTMAAALLYGLLAYFTVRSSTSRRNRWLACCGALIMTILIGFSRMYLGAHYLSDVLAACAAGFAWLVFSLTAMTTAKMDLGKNHNNSHLLNGQ